MSPEQGRGMPLDARSDLYALGVLAFEMLSGNVPFNDDNPMTVIQMHQQAAIPPMPEMIPYPVQMIVRRAMEKDPARRYQSAGEMMQHCQQVFAELNAGGVSVGGGGVPRTMIASNPQQYGMQPPQMQPPQMQQPYQQNAQAKTMIAQQSPFAGGNMPMPPQQQSGLAPQQQGGFVQANPMQKTIVAGIAPPIVGGQMMQPGMQPQGTPSGFPPPNMSHGMPPPGMQQPGMQQPGMPGPNKTVALQPTDGIVSIAQRGGAAIPSQNVVQGATTLFWVVSLAVGIAVGVIAYVIVLQT
jgi:serine/threonine-protein kinase